MKLHTSGVKLNPLGSIQDRVIRQYMTRESELQILKTQFQMISALTNPNFKDQNSASSWISSIQSHWRQYLSLELGLDPAKEDDLEVLMKQYYDQVVSKVRPVIRRDKKTGKLKLSNIEELKD